LSDHPSEGARTDVGEGLVAARQGVGVDPGQVDAVAAAEVPDDVREAAVGESETLL
jgi:hypothetical protein